MPEPSRFRVDLTELAARDFDEIIERTVSEFGPDAARRYLDLILQALDDLEADPNRIEARRTAGLPSGVVAYHLSHSRKKTHSAYGTVKKPRHFVIFRLRGSRRGPPHPARRPGPAPPHSRRLGPTLRPLRSD